MGGKGRMLGLARFAMGGRFRALLIAIASSGSLLFAWVGAGVVALVTLRKGYAEGFWLLLWAALPGVVLTRMTGDSSALAMLLGAAALAVVLRASVSMTVTAIATVPVALLTAVALLLYGQTLLTELSAAFSELLAAVEQRSLESGGKPTELVAPSATQLAGMMGVANGALSFLCLTLARYWQAALYNPGGFGGEFRALRLPRYAVFLCALVALLLALQGVTYRSWGAVFLLPLTIAGFALLHARASQRGKSGFWMGGIYAAWVVFDAAKLALVGLVIVDAVLDFRARWRASDIATKGTPDSDRQPSSSDDEEEREREQGPESPPQEKNEQQDRREDSDPDNKDS